MNDVSEQRQQPDRVPHRTALRTAGGAEQPHQRLYRPSSRTTIWRKRCCVPLRQCDAQGSIRRTPWPPSPPGPTPDGPAQASNDGGVYGKNWACRRMESLDAWCPWMRTILIAASLTTDAALTAGPSQLETLYDVCPGSPAGLWRWVSNGLGRPVERLPVRSPVRRPAGTCWADRTHRPWTDIPIAALPVLGRGAGALLPTARRSPVWSAPLPDGRGPVGGAGLCADVLTHWGRMTPSPLDARRNPGSAPSASPTTTARPTGICCYGWQSDERHTATATISRT